MSASPFQDDIAVIGLACRFPGEATSSACLRDMLQQGRSAWSEIPVDRFNKDAYWHPSTDRQGTIVAKGGYFLKEDVSKWDAPFFSMTAAEADAMDPQHRMLLEVAYESMENAGLSTNELIGSDTGCYVGAFTKDYENICTRDLGDKPLYAGTGNGPTMLANRVSWFYDLRGPSISLDTACSSSLVSVHLACEAIRSNRSDCRVALAGGVSLILAPDLYTHLSALHFLSPDGRSYSFDSRANGYARGEGCAFLVLKHIEDAVRDGDSIRAVIRGTDINQDGKTPGISLPSSDAQAALIQSTYKAASLPYSETGFFEAHGTGTAAGDPLEASSIGATFGKDKDRVKPLWVGSLKSNFGHLEGTAGVAGVIKSILSLESGVIFPQCDFQKPNPKIPMNEWNIRFPTESVPWPPGKLRRISVNSFGYGGTNAHAIIDDAYHYLKQRDLVANHNTTYMDASPASSEDSALGTMSASSVSDSQCQPQIQAIRPRLFVMSSPEQAALGRIANTHCDYLQARNKQSMLHGENILAELAYTLCLRRSTFQWRAAAVASGSLELMEALAEAAKKPLRSTKPPRTVWIFNGQGAQWARMGSELMQYEAFSRCVLEADAYLKSLGADWSVVDEFNAPAETSRINSPRFSQPLCVVLQIASVELLRHWGLRPDAVIGHSSGEISAAYAFGAISMKIAWKIAYHRGRLSDEIRIRVPSQQGAMMAVGLSEDEVQPYLARASAPSEVVVACVNSPSNVTVSGSRRVLLELEQIFQIDHVFARMLRVDNAYHSPHMEIIAEDYLTALGDIETSSVTDDIKMFSSVTGMQLDGSDLGANYWVRNMVQSVQFVKALDRTFETVTGERRKRRTALRIDSVVEIGPHGALRGPIMQFLKTREKLNGVSYYSLLSRNEDGVATALKAMGSLWSLGAKVDLQRVNDFSLQPSRGKPLVDLPAYPWNHTKSYWHESSQSKNHRFRTTARLDYLGAPVVDFNRQEPLWKNILRKSEVPWLTDHKVQNDIVFPGAGMICTALEAARQLADPARVVKSFEFRDIVIGRALVIPGNEKGVEVFTHVKPRKMGMRGSNTAWHEFTFYSLEQDGSHREHSSGLFQIIYETAKSDLSFDDGLTTLRTSYQVDYDTALAECSNTIDREELYNMLKNAGLDYGPTFRGLTDIKFGKRVACTDVTIPDTQAVMPNQYESDHLLHPATLDALFQSAFGACLQTGNLGEGMVPTSIGHLWISADLPRGAGSRLRGLTRTAERGFREMSVAITMTGADQIKPAVVIKEYVATSVGSQTVELETSNQTEALRTKICSEVIHRPDIDLLEPSQVRDLISKRLVNSNELIGWAHDSSKATTIWISRLLKSMTQQTISDTKDGMKRYFDWMEKQHSSATTGSLSHQHNNTAWLCMSEEDEDIFLEEFCTNYNAEGYLGRTIFDNMHYLLTNGDSVQNLVNVIDTFPCAYWNNIAWLSGHQLVDWIDIISHKNPDIHILEVNAGSGSVALPILQFLGGKLGTTARFGSYNFTDISSTSFKKAQDQLIDWSGLVNYQELDIEGDISEFQLPPGGVDVLLLNYLFRAPEDITVALGNCMKLLKPGGKLVILGLRNHHDFVRFTYGALSDWWQNGTGQAGDLLEEGKLWNDELGEAGFHGTDFVAYDAADESRVSMSMTVSTRPVQESCQNVILLFNPASDIQKALCRLISQQLQSLGHTVVTLAFGDAATDLHKPTKLAEAFVLSLVEIDRILLADISAKDFETFQTVMMRVTRLLWVTCTSTLDPVISPHLRTVSGLFRGISADNEGMRLQELHLHHDLHGDLLGAATLIHKSLRSALVGDDGTVEGQMIEQNGVLCIPRYYDESKANHYLSSTNKTHTPELQPLIQVGRPLKLAIGTPGMLDTLHFVDDCVRDSLLLDDHVEVEVKANAINFVDVMVAMGSVPNTALGVDVAGIVTAVGSKVTTLQIGDRVAFSGFGTFANFLRVPAQLPQKIPDAMTFEIGSSIPVVWTTAYQSLVEIAQLEKGETVLIHAAAGGLGLALIQLAHHLGAEVYATVSTRAKRELIMSMGVAEDHIFSSRDLSFASGILQMTHGKGVDVVVNSLAGEALRKTWECVSDFGRFVEVGKKDILENTGLEMMPFLRNVTFAGVNIQHMLWKSIPKWAKLFQKVMSLFQSEDFKVVHVMKVHDWTDMELCFRTLQQGRHVGKVVMRMTSESRVPVVPRNPHPLELKSNATYVLVGGLGGLGRGQAIRLAERGARNIAFLSRSATVRPEGQKTLEQLQSMGVNAIAYQCDITDRESLAQTVTRITEELAPIKGVVQGAMVLADGVFENMTHEKWLAATRPKIQGTFNLHLKMPVDLDFFVILSSVVGITGGRTQPNYAAGNTFQDAFADYRRSLGLPVQVVNLGVITGLGYIEENKDSAELAWVTAMEMITIKPDQFYAMFESALTGYSHGENRLPPQITMGAGSGGLDVANQAAGSPYQIPWLYRFAHFAYLRKLDLRGISGAGVGNAADEIKSLLTATTCMTEASDIIQGAITVKMAAAMMIEAADIDPTKPLHHYGVDSLVAVEVRNWIIRDLKSDVSIFDILASMPITQLATKIAAKSKLVPQEIRGDGEV